MRELPWMARRIGATIIVKSDGDSTTDIFQDAWAACIDEALRSWTEGIWPRAKLVQRQTERRCLLRVTCSRPGYVRHPSALASTPAVPAFG